MLEGEIISKGYSSPGRYSPCDGAIEKRILKRGLAQEGERDKKHGLPSKTAIWTQAVYPSVFEGQTIAKSG